jgi:hypothetical protein
VTRHWNTFWFTPQEATALLVIRVGVSVTLLVWALTLAPDLVAFFSADGVLPDARLETRRPSLLGIGGAGLLWGAYGALLASAIAVAAGFRVRLFAPVLWLAVLSFQYRNPLLWNAGDTLLRLFALYLALQAVVTGNLGPALGQRGPRAPYWAVRLVQLQTTAVYCFAALAKLGGSTWWDGTAVPRALMLRELQRFPIPDFVLTSRAAGALLTWSTLGVELALPVLLWWPRTRRLAIALGLVLHLGFDYGLRIGFFSGAMALGCLAFLAPGSPSGQSSSTKPATTQEAGGKTR